jgi:TATA-box binding protein (TBP) (component of TFIID and TFIIIB)
MSDLKTIKTGKDLVFPEFDDNKVSTKTIIAITNLQLNIQNVFEHLPVSICNLSERKKGRKKHIENTNNISLIKDGSIITLKLEDKLKGVDLKKKTKTSSRKKVGKFFRNSVTVVMVMDGKGVNFKVSRNGKFQMTGCKSDEQAEKCMKYFWKYIKNKKDIVYSFNNTTCSDIEITFIPAMRNIDFDLGFLVDREKLSKYINIMTQYYSMLESSFGYTGVNVKFPIKDDLVCLDVRKIKNKLESEDWINGETPYTDHLEFMTEKERNKKLNKRRFNTFLIFHSGRVLMSGLTADFMRDTYYEFLEIIRKCYDEIQEKLE